MHSRSKFSRSKSSKDLSARRDSSLPRTKQAQRGSFSQALVANRGSRRIQGKRKGRRRRNQVGNDRAPCDTPEGLIAMATLFMGHPLSQAHRTDTTLESNTVPVTRSLPRVDTSQSSVEVVPPPPPSLQKIVPVTFLGRRSHSHRSSCLSRGILPLPPRLVVKTRYQRSFNMSNPGIVYANKRLNPCYCYDIDPNFGSTAMPFFTEVMTLYRFYRTLKASITVDFVNNEAFPVTAWVCPINFDPTENSGSFQNYISNPNCHVHELAAAGSPNRGRIHKTASTDAFAGARWVGDIDAYSATGTTAPSNSWYFAFGFSTSGVGQVSGVTGSVVLTVTFVAFEEGTPSS